MRGTRRFASVLVLLGVAGAAAPASWVRTAGADGPDVEIAAQDGQDLEVFLREVSRAADIPLVWNVNDKAIQGKKIMAAVAFKAPRSRVLSLARAILSFYDLVVIPVGPREKQVLLVMDARQTAAIVKLKPLPVELTDENLASYEYEDGLFITTMLKAPHLTSLREARNAFSRIVTGQNIGNVQEVSDSTMIVTDFAPNVVAIYRLLKMMDAAAADTGVGVFKAVALKNAAAQDVARLLAAQFASAAQVLVGPQPGGVPPVPPGPRIQADARTNQVLVSGTAQDVRRVEEAIRTLDVPLQGAPTSAFLIPLRHIDAPEAAMALQALISASPSLWRGPAPAADRPSVVAHEETNALLVCADSEVVSAIREFVQAMDVEKAK